MDFSGLTLKSGGAKGSDKEWTDVASKYGVSDIQNLYVPGTDAPYGDTELEMETAKLADPYLELIAHLIGRNFPTNNEGINDLLRRDYYQIVDTDIVFAVAPLDKDGYIKGGTAWASYSALLNDIPVYHFEQNDKKWYLLERTTKEKNDISHVKTQVQTPTLNNITVFTGIGSRSIDEMDKMAIEQVFAKSC